MGRVELPDRALGKDMPIQGCFAFIDWEPRFARAELCLVADTPKHGLLPAAPIVLGGSIEEGMRAAMGDYMGLGAAIGGPKISMSRSKSLRRRPPEQPNRSRPCVSTFARKNPISPGCFLKCRRVPRTRLPCG